MLIVPNHFILLATPRTGSRALEKHFSGVSTQWDAQGNPRKAGIREHHVHPEDIEERAEAFVPGSSKLPKYTICRNPVSHLRSWYHHVEVNRTGKEPSLSGFLTFIKEADISWYFTPTLNPYRAVADVILPYEQNGQINASRISLRTGAPIRTEAPVIGASIGLDNTWLTNKEVLEAVTGRFSSDIELHAKVLAAEYD